MRDQVDQMRLEFHPDNPKIKLSILSFLLEAGVMEGLYPTTEAVDDFNEAVREMAANVTAGYQSYIDAGYSLAADIEKEIKAEMSEITGAGKDEDPSLPKGKHEDDDDGGVLYL